MKEKTFKEIIKDEWKMKSFRYYTYATILVFIVLGIETVREILK